MNLDTLQNGYDSLQIRIWYDYSLIALSTLVIIKRTNSTWTAMAYTMNDVRSNGPNWIEKITDIEVKTLIPGGGWEDFISRLFALQILTLPHMDKIPGLVDGWSDGVSYSVEIASTNQYRFYSYHLPDKFQDQYWPAKNMTEILTLIEKTFGIQWQF